MADENQQADEQRNAFKEKHGYPANRVPYVWIGRTVAMNISGSGSGGQRAPVRSSGMLEAVRDDGFVISAEEGVLFIPREAVLQVKLLEESDEDPGIQRGPDW